MTVPEAIVMKVLLILLTATLSSAAVAAPQWQFFTVLGLTTSAQPDGDTIKFGGCMAKVSPSPTVAQAGCGSTFITFSCSGDFATKSAATQNFETAQLAYITGKQLVAYVDDTKLHNGKCFASDAQVQN